MFMLTFQSKAFVYCRVQSTRTLHLKPLFFSSCDRTLAWRPEKCFSFWIVIILLFQSRRRPIRSQTGEPGIYTAVLIQTADFGRLSVSRRVSTVRRTDRRSNTHARGDSRRLTRLQATTTADGRVTVGCSRKENGNFRANNGTMRIRR